ncbi:MAG TPA: 2-phospho-L-lactate guanylyltransferase [Steroidobacteraceae bacterium]|nr:2-phospho-L-lactate guanylyltransferase [Steroidobacteraceae bacterium]
MSLTVLGRDSFFSPHRRTCALVPVKARALCKTRLAPVLCCAARVELVRWMLDAVLAAAAKSKSIQRVIVISPERDCVPPHIPLLADSGESLNSALSMARSTLQGPDCMDVAILPADLPRITAREIDALVHAGRAGGFSIAPDAAGTGTNALYVAGCVSFNFQFGRASREAHLEEARRRGLGAQLVHSPGLAFDVDGAAELEALEEWSWNTHLRA